MCDGLLGGSFFLEFGTERCGSIENAASCIVEDGSV